MSKYLFAPNDVVSLPIDGEGARFPVRRVFCVGRNYAAHAIEMGDDPTRETPFFFCKDSACVVPVALNGSVDIHYPPATSQLEYEAELVVVLQKGGLGLTIEQAEECVFGYALGVDLTRRDLQSLAKSKGRPWDAGKAFDESAPISAIVPASRFRIQPDAAIQLHVNDELMQSSTLSCLIWSVPELISKLSEQFELKAGDVVMTGTPENVGPLVVGDTVDVSIEGLGVMQLKILSPR